MTVCKYLHDKNLDKECPRGKLEYFCVKRIKNYRTHSVTTSNISARWETAVNIGQLLRYVEQLDRLDFYTDILPIIEELNGEEYQNVRNECSRLMKEKRIKLKNQNKFFKKLRYFHATNKLEHMKDNNNLYSFDQRPELNDSVDVHYNHQNISIEDIPIEDIPIHEYQPIVHQPNEIDFNRLPQHVLCSECFKPENLQRCSGTCNRFFHMECSAKRRTNANRHHFGTDQYCGQCDARRATRANHGNQWHNNCVKCQGNRNELMNCVSCKDSYHASPECIPVGAQLLTRTQLLCPTCNDSLPFSLGMCGICHNKNATVTCKSCPFQSHYKKCLKLDVKPRSYTCEGCRTPLKYDDIVYSRIKTNQARNKQLWPMIVVRMESIPDNMKLDRFMNCGLFCVRFFGTNIYEWRHRSQLIKFNQIDHTKFGEDFKGKIEGVNIEFDDAIRLAQNHQNNQR